MPWTYTIDQELDVILIHATGVLTAEELKTGVAAATGDPGFHPDIRILIDYCGVTEFAFSFATMEKMANHRVYGRNSRRAFLVATGFAAGLFAYYRSLVETGQVKVFIDRPSAVAWLNEGVPAEKKLT